MGPLGRRVGGQAAFGGMCRVSNRAWTAWAHGQWVGRCRTCRRPEVATRPGMLIGWRRTVAVVALAWARLALRTDGAGEVERQAG